MTENIAMNTPSSTATYDTQAYRAIRDHAYFGAELKFQPPSSTIEDRAAELPPDVQIITTDELFEELKKDVLARGGAKQQTDVMALNADLLEVVTEGDRHWASVRFSGSLRESPTEAPQGFEEIWNLAKPVSGQGGWQLAGIQQMH